MLKAAAYLFEERGNIEKAEDIYTNILELRPGYAQSYRDLAGIRTIAGEKRKALGLYGRYIRKSRIDTLEVPLTGIDSIVSTEVNNLVFLDSVKATRKTDNKTLQTVYWPVRILVEWNNSEAEFDLQFVNPENRFFIWSHTKEDNAERISEEKIKGYSSEQFLIDKSIAGEWKVNLKYFGNKSYDPTYFKISVYNEYGMPTQSRRIEVFKASEKNVNRYLSSIAVN